jgi:cytochrome c553
LLVLTRGPAAIHLMSDDRKGPWKTIRLADDSRADTGHAIFHANAGGFIACASCHAEGADDGHVWNFVGIGARRTPSLLGTLEGTAPYHWNGELADMRALADTIFATRMSGPKMDDGQVDALRKWLVALPALPKLREPTAASERGAEIFRARCTRCHEGKAMTNNRTMSVGTGEAVQVPSLVGVAWRSPLLHTGCAKTLVDRFSPSCGGGSHGDSGITGPEIVDLIEFLETL